MILNDENVTMRKRPRHWPGVPTRLSESVAWLIVLPPVVVAVGIFVLFVIRSLVGR